MKKNRKRRNTMSVTATRSIHFAAVIMVLFVMVLINLLAGSRCTQMQKAIGEKRNLLAKLNKDCERECGRWDQINTADNLDRILPRLGMSMKYPRAEQIVRMDGRGHPVPGQISVARAQRRSAERARFARGEKPKSASMRKRR